MDVISHPAGLGPHTGFAFVPTMGALHEGHAQLIRAATSDGHAVLVSIFVNPTQFTDPADLDRYPRTLDADLEVCREAGARAVFVPAVESVYPGGSTAYRGTLPAAATEPGLEDAHRPGHFAGVYQVVGRLFDLVRPRWAYFGEKDYQQLIVVTQMSASRGDGVRIVPVPTVREHDGLARSSRNRFIPSELRPRAAAVFAALNNARSARHAQEAEWAMQHTLMRAGFAAADIQYAAVRDARTLLPLSPGARSGRALIAATLGPVRLIDNVEWSSADSPVIPSANG